MGNLSGITVLIRMPGFKMLRFLRLFKLVKLVKVQKKLKKLAVDTDNARLREVYSVIGNMVGLLKYGFYVLYLAHILTCGWYMAGTAIEVHHERDDPANRLFFTAVPRG
eukprot:COSAG05_NODE_15495_length_368_cov_0.676580_1_plen_108_part_10